MHVFVTGGSGLVGSALIPQLVEAGHTVSALARNDSSAEHVTKLGASEVVRGDLTSLDAIGYASSKADAVVHAAFDHTAAFSGAFDKACETDRAVISAIGDALSQSGRDKVFIYTSGLLSALGPDENAHHMRLPMMPRYLSDDLTLSYASKGVRSILLRLPPVVHAPGVVHPFIGAQIAAAKKLGYVSYIEEGKNEWPSVHVKDTASLIVLALDKAPAGATLHAVDEEGIPTKDISEFISKKLNLPTKSVSKDNEEARKELGFVGRIMGIGQRITANITKQQTGWQPKEYGLFQELEGYPY